jgi:hypothetical protein
MKTNILLQPDNVDRLHFSWVEAEMTAEAEAVRNGIEWGATVFFM